MRERTEQRGNGDIIFLSIINLVTIYHSSSYKRNLKIKKLKEGGSFSKPIVFLTSRILLLKNNYVKISI
jgi:hypothetical protein